MKTIGRRAFIQDAARAGCALATGGAGILLQGCSKGKDLDLLITNAVVFDGSGKPGSRADIGIAGGSIKEIGRIRASRARSVIDADNLAASPGFIDIHQHTGTGLLVNPKAESAVRQGVTTCVNGNCGGSPFPLTDEGMARMRDSLAAEYDLSASWRDINGFFGQLEAAGLGLNYATFVGHGTIRQAVMGGAARAASADELNQMKRLVAEAMAGGAVGLSTGLEYAPGCFASTEELIELSSIAARSGGIYVTHMRDEDDEILAAVDEALRIGRETPIRLQISHLKIGYEINWPKFEELMSRIDRAHEAGLDFRCDRYPYTAWSTSLIASFPEWAREGTTEDFLRRLGDKSLDERLRSHLALKERKLGSWDKVLISRVPSAKNRAFEGRTVLAAATQAGKSPYDFMRDLLIEEGGGVGQITFGMSEDHLRVLLAHPLVGVASDGQALAPYGPLSAGKPHPRSYGTFPRALGRYVREEKLLSLEELIRKITAMPAGQLGFVRRGMLKPGWAADICIFDPGRIVDRATYVEPSLYPDGIVHVIINGVPVLKEGEHTGRLPGQILKKGPGGAVA